MEIQYCDVIGCNSPANRFASEDGLPISDRLCSYHWARLRMDSPDSAERFILLSEKRELLQMQEVELLHEVVPS